MRFEPRGSTWGVAPDSLPWGDLLCSARGCASLAVHLFDERWPLCLGCADELVERLCARELLRAAGLPPLPLPALKDR